VADWKYVMFKDKWGRKHPVIFPGSMVHADIAEAIPRAVRRGEVKAGATDYSCPEVVSAGFVTLAATGTTGESESLGIPSDAADAMVINVHPYSAGADTGMEASIERMVLVKHIEHCLKRAGL